MLFESWTPDADVGTDYDGAITSRNFQGKNSVHRTTRKYAAIPHSKYLLALNAFQYPR